MTGAGEAAQERKETRECLSQFNWAQLFNASSCDRLRAKDSIVKAFKETSKEQREWERMTTSCSLSEPAGWILSRVEINKLVLTSVDGESSNNNNNEGSSWRRREVWILWGERERKREGNKLIVPA